MIMEIAIEVKNLNISYKELKAYSIKKMLFSHGKSKAEPFHALKDVSFSISKGEIWGIIGKNGSGKSTLLNAIAGIFAPDSGTIDLHGNSVSLLSIGVGFQKNLTGRENIILGGLLLGFTQKYIEEKMQEIIDFSELGHFIDKPVRTYSSGMYSKLAFSITATLETDIILIDEVLSVGDEHFKKKSSARMKNLISNDDRTVLMVSHSLSTLKKLCDQIMWVDGGKIKMIGQPEIILDLYEKYMQ
ncbi:ABC transporter ATP-binding protein [Cuneatibacter caecimuris]|uniref:Teichoic acid transport system ATP-binding protein n=1 Tax=Cuneatibacter caecimuris TaxID=1796618 RepID=A0A4Q7NZL7_9FIRM|nr:ABC transporter ATP-binding protein [Cuneatibacter caecimuris]RZS92687.1 teichoic acid transport system ATP-binding protein [Cuneatibacter caecimuris]